mgnify:CR=1 FL=1
MSYGNNLARVVVNEFLIITLVVIAFFALFFGIRQLSNDDKKSPPVSNDAIAMEMFQKMGYNPKSVNVSEVKDGVYCGELVNETNSVWFRIGEQGVNIYQNGNVYFSTNSFKIQSVLEGIDLFTFQQYCVLRVERNQFNAPYEDLAIPENKEVDDEA